MFIIYHMFLYNLLFLVFIRLYGRLNLQKKKNFANSLLAKTVSKNSKKKYRNTFC
jgi:hypothetical protein